MPLISPYLYQINDTSWDLRKVVRWEEPSPQTVPASVNVHFLDTPNTAITFEKAPFELAMQAALNA